MKLSNAQNDRRSDKQGPLKLWLASGEPWIWLNAAAVGISLTAVVGLLLLITVKGFGHFWPADLHQFEYATHPQKSERVVGEIVDEEWLPVTQYLESGGNPMVLMPEQSIVTRVLVKTGNRRTLPPDFRWLAENQIVKQSTPLGLLAIERREWGNAYGQPLRFTDKDGRTFRGA